MIPNADPQPTNIHEAIDDLVGQEGVEATNESIQHDFLYELVNQFPLLVLEYVSQQAEMTITAESTVRFPT